MNISTLPTLLVASLSLVISPAGIWSQGQITAPVGWPAEELFQLASSSEIIAVGIVTESRGVSRHYTDPDPNYYEVGKRRGGILHTFQVEALMCAQTDFEPGLARPIVPGDSLFIFKKFDEQFYKEDIYQEGHRYLILLTALPDQEKLSYRFKLDTGHIYYEAFEGKKGLVRLPEGDLTRLIESNKIPLLTKLGRFCYAMEPEGLMGKLDRLTELLRSSDPDLSASAEKAMRVILERVNR